MLPTWCSTVLRLMNSRCEISGLDSPSPSSSTTSSSRLVSRPPEDRGGATFAPSSRSSALAASTCRDDSSVSKARSAARASATASSGSLSRETLASSSRQRDASNGSPAWVKASKASRSQARESPSPARPFASATSAFEYVEGCASAHASSCLIVWLGVLAAGQLGVDQLGEQRDARAAGRVDVLQGALAQVERERGSRRGPGAARPGPCSASGSSRPSRRLAASSYRPCRRRRSASRISAPALSVRRPSAHSRTASVSVASASGQRPAAVRMPP